MIRSFLVDEAGPHADAVLDGDAEPAALGELVADEVAELGPVRDGGGQPDLTAGDGVAFVDGDAMAAAGGGDGGLQAGRTGTHHHDVPWTMDPRRPDGDGGLLARARVLDAAQPPVETHAPDALLVARQAQADLLRGAGASLGREVGVGVWPGLVDERQPDDVIVATGAEPARPWWVPADHPNVVDVRHVLDGSAEPFGDVVVIDEIGFHHATSVAELLADRGARVEIVTNGMVVGQDLGVTLDMEGWWMRASAKGIVQSTDLVPMGMDGRVLRLLHHPTGVEQTRTPDWVVLAVPLQPVEWLYHDLVAAGRRVTRAGDCVAPRRAHAAVVEGERAGGAV